MKKKEHVKNRHLPIEQRKEIEACLDHGVTFKVIAMRIGKNLTTVSYDVKHHRKEHRNHFVHRDDGYPILLKASFKEVPILKYSSVIFGLHQPVRFGSFR